MRLSAKYKLLLGRKGAPVPYTDQVLATGPFAYWPLSETSGTQATDVAGGFHGTYNNVTLGATTGPDGVSPAPLFDASNEVVSLPAVALDTPFDPLQGTMMGWFRVRIPTVWTDTTVRSALSVGADANNRVFFTKQSINNRFDGSYRSGGVARNNSQTGYSPSGWFCQVITWDAGANEIKFYADGVQIGSTQAYAGTWAGALATTFTAIGNFSSAGGVNFWDGYIHDCALWNQALTPAEIATLAPADFLA